MPTTVRRAPVPLAWVPLVALLAACGGGETPPASTQGTPSAPPAAAPEKKPSGGFDLAALRKEDETPAPAPAPAPAEAAKPTPAPDAPKATPAPAPASAEAGTSAPDAPVSVSDIGDSEVLAAWSADEREALEELTPEERQELMDAKRKEIFLARGGTLIRDSGKMEDQGIDEATGMRGPARPDAPPVDLPPPDLQAILGAFASTDPETRAAGADMAARYEDKAAAVKFMIPLLKDRDPEVRAIAASTMGILGRVEAIAPLVKLLEREPKDVVRASALRSIGQIGGPDGVAALRTLAKEGYEPMDRSASIALLMEMKEPAALRDLLAAALKDMASEVRLSAVIAVRTFEFREFGGDVAGMLEDASDAVIIEAMRALGVLGTRSAVGPMVKILVKPHPESDNPEAVQDAAATALKGITGQDFGVVTARTDGERLAAIDAWRSWWEKNRADWR